MGNAHKALELYEFLSIHLIYLFFGKLGGDAKPKFPATISHTIRQSVPKYVHFVLWSMGWAVMYATVRARITHMPWLKFFFAQMYLTGVNTTFLFSVGQGKLYDQIHTVGALLYMVDHHILFYLLRTKWIYRFGFYFSFGAMLFFAALRARLQGGEIEEFTLEGLENENVEKPSAVELKKRNTLWWYELMIMLFENGLFTSFVSGMASGLPVLKGQHTT